jgi:hypothetical protein
MVSLGFNLIAVMSYGRNHVKVFFHHQCVLLIHGMYTFCHVDGNVVKSSTIPKYRPQRVQVALTKSDKAWSHENFCNSSLSQTVHVGPKLSRAQELSPL